MDADWNCDVRMVPQRGCLRRGRCRIAVRTRCRVRPDPRDFHHRREADGGDGRDDHDRTVEHVVLVDVAVVHTTELDAAAPGGDARVLAAD